MDISRIADLLIISGFAGMAGWGAGYWIGMAILAIRNRRKRAKEEQK